MSIQFRCQCGRQLAAKVEYAGKRMRCPACQQVVLIPLKSVVPAPAVQAPKPDPAPPVMVQFECTCGQRMQAKATNAGKMTRCPACESVVAIPDRDSGPPAETFREDLATASGQPVHVWADPEAEESPRGRPSAPRRGSPLPWVIGAVILLLLAGGGGAYWYFFIYQDKKPNPPPEQPRRPVPAVNLNGDARGVEPPRSPRQGPATTADLDLVPRDALGFVSVRVADIWNSDVGQAAQLFIPNQSEYQKAVDKVGLTPADVERVTAVITTPEPESLFAVVATSKPFDAKKIMSLLPGPLQEETYQGKTFYHRADGAIYFPSDRVLVIAHAKAIRPFLDQADKPRGKGQLSEALDLTRGNHWVVAGAVPPPQLLEEARAHLPPPLAPYQAVLGLRQATLTLDFGDNAVIDLRLKYPDDAAARKAQQALTEGLARAREALPRILQGPPGVPPPPQLGQALAQADALLRDIPVEQKGETVQLRVKSDAALPAVMTALLLPAVQKVREAANRTTSLNNLRQIGLAMHNYNLTNQKLPAAAIYSKDGKPLLSWRVALLPYIEEQALYQQFKLDEPWDSEHNIKLLPLMPKTYFHPSQAPGKDPGQTHYQVFTGPNTPFNGPEGPRIPTSFPDGTSLTLLAVEAATAVPWTKPEDVPYDPSKPVPALGLPGQSSFMAVTVDGSVRSILKTIKEQTLRALITPAGGEELKPGDF
jgi:hypothetical protein